MYLKGVRAPSNYHASLFMCSKLSPDKLSFIHFTYFVFRPLNGELKKKYPTTLNISNTHDAHAACIRIHTCIRLKCYSSVNCISPHTNIINSISRG